MSEYDPYADIARYYDAENASLVDDLEAYGLLADRFGDPVLDVGCGTGRVTLALAERGHTMTGVDSSSAMLHEARERLADHPDRDRITLVEGDIRSAQIGGTFWLAILAYSTFQHFHTQECQLAALNTISRHLEVGGGIVLDVSNPVEMYRAEDVPGMVLERTFIDSDTGQPVLQQSVVRVDRGEQMMHIAWVYDRIEDNGRALRVMSNMPMRCFTAPELRLLLERAGFGSVEVYGDYQFGEFNEDSPRLFVVATKTNA